jgi:hypothetical protein
VIEQRGIMTGRFEQDMKQACTTFIAEIERAVTAAIHAAFAQVSAHAVDAVATPRAGGPALDPLPPRRAPVPALRRAPVPASRSIDLAALREQLIGCIRDNPGSTTAQISRLLGIQPAKLRGQLGRLEAEGVFRCEERPDGFGGQPCRAYFLGEREVAQVEQTRGAPSAAPSTALGASP